MAPPATKIPTIDPIANLKAIMDMYAGSESTTTESPSTTTSTTKSNITPEQLNMLVREAMLPLAQASRAAGVYGDSAYTLGAGEIAAKIAAQNAGTTTTQTSSGGTRTTTTPGAFAPSRIGNMAQGLLMQQVGLPIAKKLVDKTGILDIGEKIANALDGTPAAIDMSGFVTPAADVTSQLGGVITQGSGDFLSTLLSPVSFTDNFLTSSVADIGTDIASDVGSSLGEEFLKQLWGFANGGQVKMGYADGGNVYIDTHVPNSNLQDPSKLKANLSALDIPIAAQLPTTKIPSQISQTGNGEGAGVGVDRASGQVSLNPAGDLASLGLTTLGIIGGPIGQLAALAVSKSSGIPTVQSQMYSAIKDAIFPGPQIPAANPMGTDPSQRTAYSTPVAPQASITAADVAPLGGDDGLGGQPGRADGTTGPFAHGGAVKGPGTGTSDSIMAPVSNGETIITAQTSQKVKQLLGDDFFLNLERMFNAPAAKSQIAQGRA